MHNLNQVREAAKKFCFSARPLRPYPRAKWSHFIWEFFFRASKKVFFISGQALAPLLSGRATKKDFFKHIEKN